MTKHIAEAFFDYFEMVPATTTILKEECYRIRYKVYCLETGFEQPDMFPDGLENDEYDAYSDHFLIRHHETGEYVATTRLILCNPNHPPTPFPIEEHCQLQKIDMLDGIPRQQIAEASRFCVSGHFKRREGERHTLAGVSPRNLHQYTLNAGDHRHTLPNFTIPLLTCLVRMSRCHNIAYWYAIMEPSFPRLLKSYGVISTAIGPPVEYHGKRRPYLFKLPDLLSQVKAKNIEAWEMLTNFGKYWHDGRHYNHPAPSASGSAPPFDEAAIHIQDNPISAHIP